MIRDPRHIALNILLLCDKKHKTLDQSIDAYHKELDALSKRDRNLCNAIVFGVLRQRESLDFYIRAFSNRQFNKINEKVRYLLRMGLYQTVYMDRIPVSAAVNTSVSIAKMLFDKKISGFVNAVLRKGCENYKSVFLPDTGQNPQRYLSVQHSMPLWLAKKWLTAYGFDQAIKLCQKTNMPPAITVRTNLLKTDRETLSGLIEKDVRNISLTVYSDAGISFTNPNRSINTFDAFESGLFQIQDEAAQIVSLLLDPQPGENVLDCCAGLGGKTNHLAQLMENKGSVLAMDIDSRKLDNLVAETGRLGLTIVNTKKGDILKSSIKDFNSYFDKVLLDAPCSGLGVLRRNPDTKWNRSQKDILRLAAQQRKMLNAAANLTAPGGVLVFAVCSCEKEENEEVVASFLKKRKDFSIDQTFAKTMKTLSKFLTKDGFFKTYPYAEDMDGFFAVRFTRKSKKQ